MPKPKRIDLLNPPQPRAPGHVGRRVGCAVFPAGVRAHQSRCRGACIRADVEHGPVSSQPRRRRSWMAWRIRGLFMAVLPRAGVSERLITSASRCNAGRDMRRGSQRIQRRARITKTSLVKWLSLSYKCNMFDWGNIGKFLLVISP